MTTRDPPLSDWLPEAERLAATPDQIRELVALGERCAALGALSLRQWHARDDGAPTVGALRDVLSTPYLYTAVRFPTLGAEVWAKSEHLAAVLRVPS